MNQNKNQNKKLGLFVALAITSYNTNAFAADAQVVTGTTRDCGTLSCNNIQGYVQGVDVNTINATSLNTTGSTNTSVGNLNGATTITGGTDDSGTADPALTIAGQNGTNAINTATGAYPAIPAGTGVLITGSGKLGTSPDVYIASQNGKSAISVTNSGVSIISPSGTSVAPENVNVTNNYGIAGDYSSGTINNNFGSGNTNSTAAINNTIGQAALGGGAVNNSFGGGTGTSNNNIGVGGLSTTTIGSTTDGSSILNQAGNTSSTMSSGVSTTNVQSSGVFGASVLGGGTTSANSGTVLSGATGTFATVDANGKITTTTGVATQSVTAMTITNGLGNTHGIIVNEQQATISGGTTSSSMTLNNNGATFSNSSTGRPIQVHGVADGTSDFDAVNVRQFNAVKLGIAGVAAMNNIPALLGDKKFNIGVGVGGFDNQSSIAIGSNIRITENFVAKASVSTGLNSNDSNINTTTWGVGASLAW